MDSEELSISLSPELADVIRNEVQSGAYENTSAIIHEALRFWQKQKTGRAQRLDEIRAGIKRAAEHPERITDDELDIYFEARRIVAEKLLAS